MPIVCEKKRAQESKTQKKKKKKTNPSVNLVRILLCILSEEIFACNFWVKLLYLKGGKKRSFS